jgi:hypothetical protein
MTFVKKGKLFNDLFLEKREGLLKKTPGARKRSFLLFPLSYFLFIDSYILGETKKELYF